MVLQNNGARLENEHLNELREKKKGKRKKYLDYSEGELYEKKHEWKLKQYKIINIYNDKELLKKKKKEIATINKYLKRIPSSFIDKIKDIIYPKKENLLASKKSRKRN